MGAFYSTFCSHFVLQNKVYLFHELNFTRKRNITYYLSKKRSHQDAIHILVASDFSGRTLEYIYFLQYLKIVDFESILCIEQIN
jgi:hypothetical protein